MPWDAQRILTLAGAVVIIALFLYFKWRRASKYVDSRNELYSEHYRKLQEYSAKVRQDKRWSGFFSQIQSRYQVLDSGDPSDKETYSVHYCCIWDETGKQYEPNQDESGVSSITAYLKRKAKPKYLSLTLSPSGEVTQEKVSGGSWYEMFERSV